MRIGEAVALQWGNIDFEDRFAEVRRAINDGRVSTSKSGKVRRVDLSAQLAKALKAHQVAQREEKAMKGWKDLPAWVFENDVRKAHVGQPADRPGREPR